MRSYYYSRVRFSGSKKPTDNYKTQIYSYNTKLEIRHCSLAAWKIRVRIMELYLNLLVNAQILGH